MHGHMLRKEEDAQAEPYSAASRHGWGSMAEAEVSCETSGRGETSQVKGEEREEGEGKDGKEEVVAEAQVEALFLRTQHWEALLVGRRGGGEAVLDEGHGHHRYALALPPALAPVQQVNRPGLDGVKEGRWRKDIA
ncbi:unnamed protein product [Closterium sp. Naga37s-1]|nr:unnamed protein product [Closterium sp. Naga37s-1]